MQHPDLHNDQNKINHPFVVSDDYFEKAQARILNEVSESKTPSFQLKWAMIPAFIIVLVASFYLVFDYQRTDEVGDLLAQVDTEDIYHYLEETEISVEDLAMLAAEQEIEFTSDVYLDDLELNDTDIDQLIQKYELEI